MKTSDFPKRVEIEFSNRCNSNCAYCPRRYGVGEEGFMPVGLYKKIIDELSAHRELTVQLHRRGESLLHPYFIDMLRYAKGKFRDIQLATNAILLEGDRMMAVLDAVDFISFSLDLPETYLAKRGVDLYDRVEKNIKDFLLVNKHARTQVSMVRSGLTTDDDVMRFRSLWADKVDRVRIYEEHSLDGVFGKVLAGRGKRVPCVKPFTDAVIYWNGKVVRCNHDWSDKPLGDMNKDNLSSIWAGAGFDRIRSEQLRLEFSDDICSKCESWYPEEGKQDTGMVFERKSSHGKK